VTVVDLRAHIREIPDFPRPGIGFKDITTLMADARALDSAVAGLADTVRDASAGAPNPNGFVFVDYTPAALLDALERALEAFGDKGKWRALQRAGMAEDHSWDRSAAEYVKIYEQLGRNRA
jgi:starch synthase